MAKTAFEVDHPLAVSAWAKMLTVEAIRQSFVGRFIGEGKGSIVSELNDLKKSAGSNITFGLRVQLQGDGVLGDATAEGNEEAMQFYDDNIVINQLRHQVRTKGRMTEQRTLYDLRSEAKDALVDWWADRMDDCFFNQICGNTAQSDVKYTGNNAVLAPSGNRIVIAGGKSDDQSLISSDTFSLDLVDIARQRAETASVASNTGPLIRPIRYMGGNYYVMFLHDYQVHDLRTNSASEWKEIQKAAMQGGDVRDNPIFTGALGIHNGVVLHKAARVTNGVNSSTNEAVPNTKRAVLCGAQSAAIAFGSDNGATRHTWNEELFDYKNQFGVSAGSIFGLKKCRFTPEDDSTTNAEDFGTVVVSTYAAPATT